MQHRNRLKQASSLEDRLAAFAKEARERAIQLPPGRERKELLRKAERAEKTRPSEWTIVSQTRPAK
jgi:protein subunit release factor A